MYRPTCRVVADPGGVTADAQMLDVTMLNVVDSPADFRVPNLYEPSAPDLSDHVRHALERLHRERHFGRIEFPVGGGLGLRTIQAKRAGLAFDDVTLAVRLDSCGPWVRDRQRCWPAGYEEVETDFAEQFSFENADERITPNVELLTFVQRLGWAERSRFAPPPSNTPLVTIGIAHFNLGRFLPATLKSLAAQTYPDVEVIVIDDGSTEADSRRVIEQQRTAYPQWRFLTQPNAGIGATRNRCLELAGGEFFIPVDADNLTRPDMIERFVGAIRRNPQLSAMTCYCLAFEGDGDPAGFTYALRPPGGPHTLAAIRNVYGDANAIFRTADFRAAGGYGTDRGTSCEDWEAFVKLVHAGKQIGVVPDHLFYYRHRPGGFSRATNWFANHERVLRQFANAPAGPEVWAALLGFHQRLQQLERAAKPRRHRIADAVHSLFVRLLPGTRPHEPTRLPNPEPAGRGGLVPGRAARG